MTEIAHSEAQSVFNIWSRRSLPLATSPVPSLFSRCASASPSGGSGRRDFSPPSPPPPLLGRESVGRVGSRRWFARRCVGTARSQIAGARRRSRARDCRPTPDARRACAPTGTRRRDGTRTSPRRSADRRDGDDASDDTARQIRQTNTDDGSRRLDMSDTTDEHDDASDMTQARHVRPHDASDRHNNESMTTCKKVYELITNTWNTVIRLENYYPSNTCKIKR